MKSVSDVKQISINRTSHRTAADAACLVPRIRSDCRANFHISELAIATGRFLVLASSESSLMRRLVTSSDSVAAMSISMTRMAIARVNEFLNTTSTRRHRSMSCVSQNGTRNVKQLFKKVSSFTASAEGE